MADYPGVEEFQKIIARLLREAEKEEQALFAWLGVSLRFPNSMVAFHNLAVLVHRRNGPKAVKVLVEARFVRMPIRLDQLLAYAEACDLAEATAERTAAFERLGRMFKKHNDSWLQTASWLEEEYGINKPARSAATLLSRLAAGTGLGPGIVRERKRLHSIVSDREHPGRDEENTTASVKVLGALFDRVLEQRQAAVSARPRKAGSAVLLTGSLGAGGAERQLVTTAIGLNEMNAEQRTLRDGVTLSSVDVMARSLRDRKDGSFFLGDLQRADVLVRSYRDLPDFAGNLATSAVRPALSALGYCPGLRRRP